MYSYAKAYYEKKGHLRIPITNKTEDGHSLGRWIWSQRSIRRGFNRGVLSEERIAALDKLGMVWDVDKFLWEQKFETAQRYFQVHGNLQVPARYTAPDGICLGAWIQSARQDYKSGRLDEASIQRLEAIGMVWDARQTQWEQQYQAAQDYYLEYGHLRVKKGYVTQDGICLGTWILRIRQWHKQKKLTADQVKRLESIGMVWDGVSDRWERNYQAALAYYREHGDLNIPTRYVSTDGLNLGLWAKTFADHTGEARWTGNRSTNWNRLVCCGACPDDAENRGKQNRNMCGKLLNPDKMISVWH